MGKFDTDLFVGLREARAISIGKKRDIVKNKNRNNMLQFCEKHLRWERWRE